MEIVATECNNCGLDIRVVLIEDKGFYWCNKIECIVRLCVQYEYDWRVYIPPKQFKEALEIEYEKNRNQTRN